MTTVSVNPNLAPGNEAPVAPRESQHAAKETTPPIQGPKVWSGGGAVSLRELQNDPELAKPLVWDLYPYAAPGRFTLLASPPKTGKSTFAAHYAAAKAAGGPFLGQPLHAAPVLWVGPDEHPGDQVRRFTDLGAPPDSIYIWRGPAPSIEEIAATATQVGAGLVVIDTLSRVADIRDENDNAEWTRWTNRALQIIHKSPAAWVVLHHVRKSGGEDGDAIRGASAIFGSTDVAVSLRRHGNANMHRRLVLEGTRLSQTDELLIELRDREYCVVGSARTRPDEERPGADEERVRNVLTMAFATVQVVATRLDPPIPQTTLRRYLDTLVKRNAARRDGTGGQRDPFRYASCANSQGPDCGTRTGHLSLVPHRRPRTIRVPAWLVWGDAAGGST